MIDAEVPACVAAELQSLADHNVALIKENSELRKSNLLRESTDIHTQNLESAITRLQDANTAVEAENARLRKDLQDLSKRLEKEHAAHAEEAASWQLKEIKLLEAVRAEREIVKGLKALMKNREEELRAAPRPDTPDLAPSPMDCNDIVPKLQDEIAELKSHIENLTILVEARDLHLARQEDEIEELQSTVSALMDELEQNYERVQFETPIAGSLALAGAAWSINGHNGAESSSDAGSDVNSSSPVLKAAKAAITKPRVMIGSVTDVSPTTNITAPRPPPKSPGSGLMSPPKTPPTTSALPPLILEEIPLLSLSTTSVTFETVPRATPSPTMTPQTPLKSFTSLAEELSRLGETAPSATTTSATPTSPTTVGPLPSVVPTGEPGSLRNRLAAYGLNTEGNRKILKKRLQAYVKRRQQQASTKKEQQT